MTMKLRLTEAQTMKSQIEKQNQKMTAEVGINI